MGRLRVEGDGNAEQLPLRVKGGKLGDYSLPSGQLKRRRRFSPLVKRLEAGLV
jgi:hypothetical protein